MPHQVRKRGVLEGTALAVFLALVHTVNDAITAILGALLPTIEQRFDADGSTLALIVATYWVASSLTQPLFGSLAEDVGLRLVAAAGVVMSALFLSLVGVAPELPLVFLLLVIGGFGSAALHPVGTSIAAAAHGGNRTLGVGLFTAGGMIGFAAGPLLILYVVAQFGVDATPWLMAPGIAFGLLVYVLLPDWAPHGRRPLRELVDARLLRGPIGWLVIAASLTSVAFVTFTSMVPLWLVNEHGYAVDAPLIGITLGVFALAAGAGSVLGGIAAPRIGRTATVVGSLLATPLPLLAMLRLDPGSVAFFAAVAAAGALIYVSSPVKVVVAQELAPHAPAATAGLLTGATAGIAGAAYVGLGLLQDTLGLEPTMALSFLLLVAAAGVSFAVLRRVAPRSG